MALLANNIGEAEMLARIIGAHDGSAAGDSLMLRLFKVDITPAEGDSLLEYVESDGTGYVAIAITGDSTTADAWTYATGAGDTVSATYIQQTFTYTAGTGDTLYGYYVTSKNEAGDTVCMWAEAFTDGPYTIPAGGGTVKVTPKIQLD